MIADYHMHTFLCRHADGKAAEYVATAREKGIPEICFADHAPAPGGYDAAHRMTIEEFGEYKAIVGALAGHEQPSVLWGIEADFYEGCEQFLRHWIEEQDFDLVIGSVHYIRDWGFDCEEFRTVWDTANVRAAWGQYLDLVGRLADSGLYDIVGHLDLPKKFGHRLPDRDVRELADPVLDRIAAAGMAVELNTSGLRKPVGEIYPSLCLLRLCREKGIPICFGSDAHSPREVGHAFDKALNLAFEAGYTECVRFRRRSKTPVPLAPPHMAGGHKPDRTTGVRAGGDPA